MWKQCCDLIAQVNEQSYPDDIFDKDLHHIDRDEDFFIKSPLDNILMRKQQILVCIA